MAETEQHKNTKSRLPIYLAIALFAFAGYRYYVNGLESKQEVKQESEAQVLMADMEKEAAERKVADSLDLLRLDSISKYELVNEAINGCGYKVYYYQLHKKIKDSAAVDFMAEKLLEKSYETFEPTADCQQKKYVRVNVYQPGEAVTPGNATNAVATYEMGEGAGYSPYINTKHLK